MFKPLPSHIINTNHYHLDLYLLTITFTIRLYLSLQLVTYLEILMTHSITALSNKLLFTATTLLSCLLASHAIAYEIGDDIDSEVAKKLNLDPEKITLVDFFASWCKSCAKEIPGIKQVAQQGEINVIGIDVDDELEDGLVFQKKLSIDFPVINDTEQEIISKFAPIGMPAMYYVKNNKIIGKHIGAIDDIETVIKQDMIAFEE
jgi:cytochrome c biogenesis protein CcmG/thiol:disulfide interchange protein DsbE